MRSPSALADDHLSLLKPSLVDAVGDRGQKGSPTTTDEAELVKEAPPTKVPGTCPWRW
jgi:hypothetical protein